MGWTHGPQNPPSMSPVSQFFHETSTCESVDVCGEFFFGEADVIDQFFQRCQRCSTGLKGVVTFRWRQQNGRPFRNLRRTQTMSL